MLYDGECGLCSRLNRFVVPRDRRKVFRYAPLQGGAARDALRRHGREPDLDTFFVVCALDTPQEALLARSDAAAFVLRELGGVWRAAALVRFLPRRLRDGAYDIIAQRRYALFGRADPAACPHLLGPGE